MKDFGDLKYNTKALSINLIEDRKYLTNGQIYPQNLYFTEFLQFSDY